MSTTTQILYNSPALHSLKREQLVKLCKIHAIKASGKNTDLIQKLQQHAETLLDNERIVKNCGDLRASPSSERTLTEGDDDQNEQPDVASKHTRNGWGYQDPRPSEQWEAMESIAEVEESSSQGTLTSLRTLGSGSIATGEFGSGSSKSTSVSSSIKTLATTLGLKRTPSANPSPFAPKSSSKATTTFNSPSKPYHDKEDSLTRHGLPYSSATPGTLPRTDHFVLSTPYKPTLNLDGCNNPDISVDTDVDTQPLPGHVLRPGMPAPANARLSFGQNGNQRLSMESTRGPTTTIRLVTAPFSSQHQPSTPQLRPFETTYDLIVGTPANTIDAFNFGDDKTLTKKMNVWPPPDENSDREPGIYPALSTSELHMAHGQDSAEEDEDVPMPGAIDFGPPRAVPTSSHTKTPRHRSSQPHGTFTPISKLKAALTPTTAAIPTPIIETTTAAPFIFGSPLPQHNLSNMQFRSAAVNVLEEMNKRLAEEGVAGVDLDVLGRARQAASDQALIGALPAGRPNTTKEKFDRMHEEEFKKMDSIANHYAARRDGPGKLMKKRKSSSLSEIKGAAGATRRSSGLNPRRAGARVISGPLRKNVGGAIPGAFGAEDEEDEEPELDRRMSKRPRVDGVGDGDSGAPSNANANGKRVSMAVQEDPEEEEKKQKEREAIRRKLDMNKARRRSSMGRPSIGGAKVTPAKSKPTGSKFGFLSSAKSMMQSVWKGASFTPAKNRGASKVEPSGKQSGTVPSRPSALPSKTSAGALAPSNPSRLQPSAVDRNSKVAPPNRSKSPISAVVALPSVAASTRSGASSKSGGSIGGTSSRQGSSIGLRVTSSSRFGSKTSAGTGPPSSLGTKASGSISRASSLGTRSSLITASTDDAGSANSKRSPVSKRFSSSRLLAPTASSLAKTQHNTAINSARSTPAPGSPRIRTLSNSPLEIITNSSSATTRRPLPRPQSPKQGQIFSKPLTSPAGVPIVSYSGNPGQTIAAAAAQLTEASHAISAGSGIAKESTKPQAPAKARATPGRKPRISRSRVIAKLASQRAATNAVHGGVASALVGVGGVSGGSAAAGSRARTRSSLGAVGGGAVKGKSFGVTKPGRGSGGGDVMMSAKKRVRQSEYARRRSRPRTGSSVDVGVCAGVADVNRDGDMDVAED